MCAAECRASIDEIVATSGSRRACAVYSGLGALEDLHPVIQYIIFIPIFFTGIPVSSVIVTVLVSARCTIKW